MNEATAPAWLLQLQAGFAKTMRTPLLLDADGYEYDVDNYVSDIRESMVDGPVLTGLERLNVYNQQYWFRLLTVLQRELPLTRRRLGIVKFNQMATAYLDAYPSAHPGLEHLVDRILDFLDGDCHVALREAAELDVAHARAFDAAEHEEFDGSLIAPEQMPQLLAQPLRFQSAWRLYRETHSNVVDRRQAVAETESDEVIELRALPQPLFWAIYRNAQAKVCEEPLDDLQYQLLHLLADGLSLTAACDQLLSAATAEQHQQLERGMGPWFQRWTALGWFVLPDAE